MEDLIQKAAEDLIKSNYSIALTGAGMSTESGIPDFRGPDGIWTKNPEAEMKAYEIYDQFKSNPKEYWMDRLDPQSSLSNLFAVLGELGEYQPNPGHYALAELEKMGMLKSLLTQNVDGLHQKGGSRNVIEYHGGVNKFRCIRCNKRFNNTELNLEKIKSEARLPPLCQCGGTIKDDGVFFGEPIPSDAMMGAEKEARQCDLMLVCGTSAVVYPFAHLPQIAKPSTIIIEINAQPTPLTGRISHYLIQGKTGEILPKIVERVKHLQ